MTQPCWHMGWWHRECCCPKTDAQPWHHSVLLVPLGGEGVVWQLGEWC